MIKIFKSAPDPDIDIMQQIFPILLMRHMTTAKTVDFVLKMLQDFIKKLLFLAHSNCLDGRD